MKFAMCCGAKWYGVIISGPYPDATVRALMNMMGFNPPLADVPAED
jgi:hypothetical protein